MFDELRKISKLNIGGNQKQSQEQMPKTAKISDFGFNISSDLMKTVTASCSDAIFENAIITGGDIFSITVDRKIDTIEEFIDYCYQKSGDTPQPLFCATSIVLLSGQYICDKVMSSNLTCSYKCFKSLG